MPDKSLKKRTSSFAREKSFRELVYEEVKKIPKGQTRTYKEIARAIGRPRAYRAVGNALNKNPDLKNIPCHRVIRSDGKIGDYLYGAAKKKALLEKEGAVLSSGSLEKKAI